LRFVASLVFVVSALSTAACDPPSPSAVVRFAAPASPDDAERVEVSLLPTCAGQEMGASPVAPLTTVDLTPTRSRPLGTFDRGDYGLYARAFDAACVIVAAGCEAVNIGDDDPLEVSVSPLMGPGCEPTERCAAEGRCVRAEAMGDASGDGEPPDGA